MRILLDQGTPVPLRDHLLGHAVTTAFELGWSTLENGALLAAAANSFDLFITTDQNLRHQQNLNNLNLRIVVLLTTSWPRIQLLIPRILAAIDNIRPCEVIEITDH